MISEQALIAALPDVMAAPRDAAQVAQLCFRPDFNQREFPLRLHFTRAEGVPGERWLKAPWLKLADGSPDPNIQVSILPQRVHDLICTGPDMIHPGDTIIADLLTSEENLPAGSLLAVGEAVLRVSDEFNDGCVKWKARYGAAAKAWITAPGHPALRLRGILCAIEKDGWVAVGDPIKVISRG